MIERPLLSDKERAGEGAQGARGAEGEEGEEGEAGEEGGEQAGGVPAKG